MEALQDQSALKACILKSGKKLFDEDPGYYLNYKRTAAVLRKECAALKDPYGIAYHCIRDCASLTTKAKWAYAMGPEAAAMCYYATANAPIKMRKAILGIPTLGEALCNRRHPTGHGYCISMVRLFVIPDPKDPVVFAMVYYRPKTPRPDPRPTFGFAPKRREANVTPAAWAPSPEGDSDDEDDGDDSEDDG